MTESESKMLADVGMAQGGFTYDLRERAMVATGFAFSPYKGLERKVGALTPETIREYVETHKGALLSILGAWKDGETWYLDAVFVCPDRERALYMARAASQVAIYDLSKGETVYC